MVGSAIVRALEKAGYHNIVTRTHKELNLCRQQDVEDFFAAEKPDYVFWQQQRSGASSQTRKRWRILCMTT